MSKPNIYAFSDSLSKHPTIHKEDYDNEVGTTEIEIDDLGHFELPQLNVEYTLHKSGSSTTSWGIEMEFEVLIDGSPLMPLLANPDENHTFTDLNGTVYKMPKIPVDGDYIKYVVTKAEPYHLTSSSGGSNDYYRVLLRYKTKNTSWQNGSLCAKLPSGVGFSNLSYGYILVLSGVDTVKKSGTIPTEINKFNDEVASIQERLNELGFKQGTVYYDGEAVSSAIASIKKQGKYALLSFTTINQSVSKISVSNDFKPKEATSFTVINVSGGISLGTTLSISTNGEITINNQGITATNVGWEIN